MKATEGPYYVVKSKNGVDGGHQLIASVENGNEDMTLLIMSPNIITDEFHEPFANANLLAASRDLYKASKALLSSTGDCSCRLCGEMRAALKKAEGE